MTDIGVWMLSDKAVKLLVERSGEGEYDLYGEFGCALGTNPTKPDGEISNLKVAIVPLAGGEFYHFGTSKEIYLLYPTATESGDRPARDHAPGP